MPEQSENGEVTVSVDHVLECCSSCIHRVSNRVRATNPTAYDPTIVAIGPFHRDKADLKNMEHQKERYLEQILESRGELDRDPYLQAIEPLEAEARRCYSDPVGLGADRFVEMLLLDAAFITGFLREYDTVVCAGQEPVNHAIFRFGHVMRDVLEDLVLLENQIPFFVLKKLFHLWRRNEQETMIHLVWPLLSLTRSRLGLESLEDPDNDEDHLLGFVHCLECMPFSPDVVSPSCVMENIISATELKQAGVSFNKAKDGGEEVSWLDIEFKNNKIIVPTLEVSDTTESKLRNMMAYEHYLPCSAQKHVTDYVFFMSRLIHDAKDAQILRRYGIISNWLGGDEAVYQLFNRMGTQAEISLKFSYINVFHDVNLYCGRRRNRWIAMLRRDYFNSPWKLISFIAGVVLLGVGIAQMVFAILSYGKLVIILHFSTCPFKLIVSQIVWFFFFLPGKQN